MRREEGGGRGRASCVSKSSQVCWSSVWAPQGPRRNRAPDRPLRRPGQPLTSTLHHTICTLLSSHAFTPSPPQPRLSLHHPAGPPTTCSLPPSTGPCMSKPWASNCDRLPACSTTTRPASTTKLHRSPSTSLADAARLCLRPEPQATVACALFTSIAASPHLLHHPLLFPCNTLAGSCPSAFLHLTTLPP